MYTVRVVSDGRRRGMAQKRRWEYDRKPPSPHSEIPHYACKFKVFSFLCGEGYFTSKEIAEFTGVPLGSLRCLLIRWRRWKCLKVKLEAGIYRYALSSRGADKLQKIVDRRPKDVKVWQREVREWQKQFNGVAK